MSPYIGPDLRKCITRSQIGPSSACAIVLLETAPSRTITGSPDERSTTVDAYPAIFPASTYTATPSQKNLRIASGPAGVVSPLRLALEATNGPTRERMSRLTG